MVKILSKYEDPHNEKIVDLKSTAVPTVTNSYIECVTALTPTFRICNSGSECSQMSFVHDILATKVCTKMLNFHCERLSRREAGWTNIYTTLF